MVEVITNCLRWLTTWCAAREVQAWLVGGAIRDLLTGRIPHDLDVSIDGNGLDVARDLAAAVGGSFVLLDDERCIGRVVVPLSPGQSQRITVDLVQLRAATIEEDLTLRDITVNAIACPLTTHTLPILVEAIQTLWHAPLHDHEHHFLCDQLGLRERLKDPCGGLCDLRQHTIRLCHPRSILDDPLRILRIVRLAADRHLQLSPEVVTAMTTGASGLDLVAQERIREELLKLLQVAGAARWLQMLDATGVLTRLFPELEAGRTCDQPLVHFLPVLAHQLETVVSVEWLLERSPYLVIPAALRYHPDLDCTLPYREKLVSHMMSPMRSGYPRIAFLKLAALLHDNAKPQTKRLAPGGRVSFHGHHQIGAEVALQIARRLRMSREESGYLTRVIREHMRPFQLRIAPDLTPRALARFFRDTGEDGPDILIHELADHLASRGPHLDVHDWREHVDWTTRLLTDYWVSPPSASIPPLINGHDLMHALGLEPGRLVGIILRDLREAQMANEISSREEALTLARQILRHHQQDDAVGGAP